MRASEWSWTRKRAPSRCGAEWDRGGLAIGVRSWAERLGLKRPWRKRRRGELELKELLCRRRRRKGVRRRLSSTGSHRIGLRSLNHHRFCWPFKAGEVASS